MTLIPHPNDPAITPSMLNPFNKTSGKAKGAEKEGETKPHKRFDPTAVECRSAEILYSQDRMKMKEPLPLEKLLRQPWTMEEPMSGLFKGYVGDLAGVTEIVTDAECEDSCFFSNLPIVAGSYGGDQRKGKKGIYYEVVIEKMEGEIAIGSACLPYPCWRLPGLNRHSVGLHLKDSKIFSRNSQDEECYEVGTRPKEIQFSAGDSIGFGFKFATKKGFFTHNGKKLSNVLEKFSEKHDVYAAIGVEGANVLRVNFGTDAFRWKKGNKMAWRSDWSPLRFEGTVDEKWASEESLILDLKYWKSPDSMVKTGGGVEIHIQELPSSKKVSISSFFRWVSNLFRPSSHVESTTPW